MNKDIAKKWVRALRSKKYRQAKGVLKIKNKAGKTSHCCLGVLCELYQAEQKKTGKTLMPVQDQDARDSCESLPKTSRVYEFDKYAITVLPQKVRRWAGMADDAGLFRREFQIDHRGKAYSSLAEMNDDGCNFSTIAKVIAEHPARI
jgi:hypothetical protein